MKKLFVFGQSVTGDNFTDREKETRRLKMNFTHGVNTILITMYTNDFFHLKKSSLMFD